MAVYRVSTSEEGGAVTLWRKIGPAENRRDVTVFR